MIAAAQLSNMLRAAPRVEEPGANLLQGVSRALRLRRPTLTEALAGAGALCAAYCGYKLGQGAYARISVSVNRVRAWWRGPLRLRPAIASPRCGETVSPESAVPGSEERSMTPPKGQCVVGFRVDGTFHVVGCAVRLDEWLVMPDHVKSAVGSANKIELLSHDRKRSITLTAAEVESIEILDTDCCELRLAEARFSELGLGKPSVAPCLSEDVGGYCSIVGAYGQGTTGTLRHSILFGKVNYSGTTCKGYSGAAYMLGTQLAGIHLHGGTVNSGYSSSYLLAMLKHKYRIKDEDSADWLEGQKKSGARVEVDPEWRDLDECRVRVNGRYHILGSDVMSRVYGNDWRRMGSKKEKRQFHVDPESAGEAKPVSSGASSTEATLAPLVDADLTAYTNVELERLIAQSRKTLVARRQPPK